MSMRVAFRAPHLAAQCLDDARLKTTCDTMATALMWWHRDGLLPDAHTDCEARIWRYLGEDEHHVRALRMYLLHMSMEHEYRFGFRPESADVLDTVPFRPQNWPMPETAVGRSAVEEHLGLVEDWREQTELDDVPIWTRRRPPEWLPTILWHPEEAQAMHYVSPTALVA